MVSYCRESQVETQVVFQAETQAENFSIESPPRRAPIQTSPVKSFSTPEKESALRSMLMAKGTVRDELYKDRSFRKIDSQIVFSRE